MQPLHKVIVALQQQLAVCLNPESSTSPSSLAQPRAGRCTISIQFVVVDPLPNSPESEPQFAVPSGSPPPAASSAPSEAPAFPFHTLTIEFLQPAPASTPRRKRSPVQSQDPNTPRPLQGADADRVLQSLASIFGSPGFDSAARASVFREALAELTPAQAQSALDLLHPLPADADPALKRARHLVNNIIKSGQLTPPLRGQQLITELFQLYPIPSLLDLIQQHWKTQADW